MRIIKKHEGNHNICSLKGALARRCAGAHEGLVAILRLPAGSHSR
jgi:hypothetical protein